MMNMVPISSSNLAAVGWSEDTGLVVEFKSGAVYHYPDAPRSIFGAIQTAQSPGSYFARFVKGVYAYERQ